MIIYAPNEYPAPLYHIDLACAAPEPLTMSVRHHVTVGAEDQFMHFDQLTVPVLQYTDDGALLLDVWAESNSDWVASTIFLLTADHLALREARTFGRWREMGLVHLMTSVAQNLTGWTKQISGHRWANVW
ncbi:hypothetical protein BC777_0103 [Yoonia maricola]|uniref:Uncharacterized protein n=1 Tax=Yoonia maricola TaxID=420999 RepID=A0A2M8WK33_9RHOB|nr:hypothetical protein [Yoonia maricola]PJI91279.1 hypothetical protein BC777_0103 [Yoonia maricola]